jgi:hypothetical protein
MHCNPPSIRILNQLRALFRPPPYIVNFIKRRVFSERMQFSSKCSRQICLRYANFSLTVKSRCHFLAIDHEFKNGKTSLTSILGAKSPLHNGGSRVIADAATNSRQYLKAEQKHRKIILSLLYLLYLSLSLSVGIFYHVCARETMLTDKISLTLVST